MNNKYKFYILYFLIIMVFPLSAYIDPATGSMLFSALVGILASAYFLFKQLFMKLKFLSPGKKAETQRFHSIILHSEGAQYWNVFKPLLDALVERGEACAYLSADENDPGLNYSSDLVHTRYIGTGNRAYMRLNMLEADICVSTTPGLDVLQFKRSRRVKHYVHILHHLNTTATYRLFGVDYYDSVLLNGKHQEAVIRELEKGRATSAKALPIVGSTYLDSLQEKIKTLPSRDNQKFTILISPSWGPNSILNKYGMDLIKPIADSGMSIILRPHPQSSISEKPMLETLQEALRGYENIEWDFNKENLKTMSRVDVMISDFSSIIFDFIFLFSKPVVIFNYSMDTRGFDMSDIQDANPHYMVRDSGAVIHMETDDFNTIPQEIKVLSSSSDMNESIEKLKKYAWKFQGQAGHNAAEYIIEKKNELNTKKFRERM